MIIQLTSLLLLSDVTAAAAQFEGPQASAPATARLSDEQIREVIGNIATAVEGRYVDPAAGAKIASHLRSELSKGTFANYSDPAELAPAITKALREAVADVHLRAVFEPNRSPSTVAPRQGAAPAGPGPRSFGRIDPRSDAQLARTNFGFDAVQRLGGNVGYLKIAKFVPLELSLNTATSAMQFLANSDAVIVDLRGNIGGSPDLVRQILSYFTGPKPAQLLAHEVRGQAAPNVMTSLAEVPGTRLTGKPLYVLIDRYSASSAEAFAYIVQRKKMGVVIGETSSGAGNGGNMLPAGYNISFFIPFARVIDGPGWEQIGVKPDLQVDPDTAVNVAHLTALEQLIARADEPVVRREREWALEFARAEQIPSGIYADLSDYAGQFGTRGFKAEKGSLWIVPSAGEPEKLLRVSRDVFRADNARFTFSRDSANRVTSVTIDRLSASSTVAPRTDRTS